MPLRASSKSIGADVDHAIRVDLAKCNYVLVNIASSRQNGCANSSLKAWKRLASAVKGVYAIRPGTREFAKWERRLKLESGCDIKVIEQSFYERLL